MAAAAIPSAPTTGTIIVDSADSNKLKWYNGSAWQSAGAVTPPGGSDTHVQFNNAGAFGGTSELTWASAAGLVVTRSAVATAQSVLRLDNTVSGTAASGNYRAFVINLTRAVANTNTVNLTGIRVDTTTSGGDTSVDPTVLRGIDINANNTRNSGSLFGVTGAQVAARSQGTSTFVIGVLAYADGAGTATDTVALYARGSTSASVTNYYGLKIEESGAQSAVNLYGVYQAGDSYRNVFEGSLETAAPTAARAGLRLPHGVVPTSPVDGDLWTTSDGLFVRVNSLTVGPLGTGGGGGSATVFASSFPGSPTQGTYCWRTDLDLLFLYEGAAWVGISYAGTAAGSAGEVLFNLSGVTAGATGLSYDSSLTRTTSTSLRIPAATLPLTTAVGLIAIDSADGNKLKWHNGTAWQTAGITGAAGSNAQLQFNAVGTLSGAAGLTYDTANLRTSLTAGVLVPATLPGSPIAGQLAIDSADANAFKWYNGSSWVGAGGALFVDKVVTPASTTASASLNIAHGVAPTTPVNGDVWTTTSGMFARINGATIGPLGAGSPSTSTMWTNAVFFNPSIASVASFFAGTGIGSQTATGVVAGTELEFRMFGRTSLTAAGSLRITVRLNGADCLISSSIPVNTSSMSLTLEISAQVVAVGVSGQVYLALRYFDADNFQRLSTSTSFYTVDTTSGVTLDVLGTQVSGTFNIEVHTLRVTRLN